MAYGLTPNVALLILLAVASFDQAAAQVYRCNDGDMIVFSDVPCSEDAQLYHVRSGISVVAAADDLDEVAERNRAFVDKRQEDLAERRARAAELAQQAGRSRQRRAAAEETRYRTIIGPVADSRADSGRLSPTDPRVEAQRQRAPAQDEPERRRTLLSRSGGNQPRILR